MKKVCLDTHILIWGVKGESTPGQEDMISKAKQFFKWLENGAKNVRRKENNMVNIWEVREEFLSNPDISWEEAEQRVINRTAKCAA